MLLRLLQRDYEDSGDEDGSNHGQREPCSSFCSFLRGQGFAFYRRFNQMETFERCFCCSPNGGRFASLFALLW